MSTSYPKPSVRQRLGVALASVLITLCIVLVNVQLARHEAQPGSAVHAAVAQGIVCA